MDFEDAIKALKNGHRVKREDWGGFWYLPGGYVPVSLHMADMLADDWVDLDKNDENPKLKTLEEKKEDFYYFLQLLKRILKISDISGTYPQYTIKIKDKYVRFDLGTHSYYLADTAEHNSFGDSSVLSSNEIIEGLQVVFTSYDYNFDKTDVTISNAVFKKE